MREDYVWDKSGDAEPDLVALERTLGALRHDQPMGALPSGTFQRAPVAKSGWAKPIVYGALLSSSLTVLLIWLFLQLGGSAPTPQPVPATQPVPMGPAPVTAPAPKPAPPEHDPKEVERLRRDLQTTLDRLDALVLRLEELEKKQVQRDAEAKARAKVTPRFEPPPEPVDPLDEILRPPSKPKAKKRNPGVECILDPSKCRKDSHLPEKLTSSDIKAGVNPVKAEAKACGAKHGAAMGEKVTVKISILGRTGRVTSSSAVGRHAGTPVGNCVAKALAKAEFPRFRKTSLGVQYPIRF